MLEAGIEPDVVTFTTIITAFIESGNVQGAEEWFGRMQAVGIKANLAAFTCVITVLSLECALLLPVSQTLDETVLRAACQAIPDIWFVLESDDQQRHRLCLFGWNQYCRTYQPHQPEVESAMMAAQALFFVVLQRCIRIRLIAALRRMMVISSSTKPQSCFNVVLAVLMLCALTGLQANSELRSIAAAVP
jgi:pentatricopeptide repeat protein